jgi:hypothetical protein
LDIDGVNEIIVADKLTADNVVLAQTTPDVMRLVVGMGLSTIEWASQGNMVHQYKVMTIMVPQFRADSNNRAGIIHYT